MVKELVPLNDDNPVDAKLLPGQQCSIKMEKIHNPSTVWSHRLIKLHDMHFDVLRPLST